MNGYITTGHHTEDYLETVLIHLIRGSGYSAFNSLPVYGDGIFRPLLVFTRKEMEAILETEIWEVYEDESNHSDLFLRNRIRKTILPILKQEGLNPNKLHENFHNADDLAWEENEKRKPLPSFLKIDRNTLKSINLGNLKLLLDTHARIFKIHPFTKNILSELKKELEKNTSFLIENKELLLWKNPTSDLFLIPAQSPALQKPKLIQKNTILLLEWNGNTKEISLSFQIDFWQKGLKILKNGKHRDVSELFREKQIPIPVREFVPILFKESKAVGILFSLWDDRCKDFIGDSINEIR